MAPRRLAVLDTVVVVIALCTAGVSGATFPQGLIYTPVSPCRIVDTRVAGGALSAGVSRTLTVVGSSTLAAQGGSTSGCGIPPFDAFDHQQASAVLINFVAVGPTAAGDLVAWPSDQPQPTASVLNYQAASVDHLNIANAVILPLNQSSSESAVGNDITVLAQVGGTHLVADVYGYFTFASAVSGSGQGNLFIGNNAGNQAATTASNDIGIGVGTLQSVTTGDFNVAVGGSALNAVTTTSMNTAVGGGAMTVAVGGGDTALGGNALNGLTTGTNNTALGGNAMVHLGTGSSNIAVGFQAGSSYDSTEHDNILIGNSGIAKENETIHIGSGQTATFVAGIEGGTVGSTNDAVLVNGAGKLGTAVSSIRFKEDVQDMAGSTDPLFALRPVTFHYKAPYDDDAHLLQYGLIAEEVERVLPGLVVHDAQGRPLSVRYHWLAPMLLNELQKEHARLESASAQLASATARADHQADRLAVQERELDLQRTELARQQALLSELAARLATLEKPPAVPERERIRMP